MFSGFEMSYLPSTMKAVVLTEAGGPEKLEYTEKQPLPNLYEGQVLVKNTFAGVNFIDTYFRTGYYPSPSGYPLILGQEAAGVIEKVEGPNLFALEKGDRVVWIAQGGYAEYTALPARQVIKIPSGVTDEDAVGAFLMGMTALSLVKEAFLVQKGHTVLVHAAAGGVGLLLCQILKDIGAITIGTAGGPEKCALAKENGATHVIDYRATSGPSWVAQVKELTNGEGPDVVYDSVGKDTWEGSLDVVKLKGKVVFIGASSGSVPPLNVESLNVKNVSVMKPTLRNSIGTRKDLEFYANSALSLVKDGKLKIKVHKIYPLEDVRRAHEDLEGRKTTGKLLLRL